MDSPRYGICGFPMSTLLIVALGSGLLLGNFQNRILQRQIQDSIEISKRSAEEEISLLSKCDGEKVKLQHSINQEKSQKEQVQKQVDEKAKAIADKDSELDLLKKTKLELEAQLSAAATSAAPATAAPAAAPAPK